MIPDSFWPWPYGNSLSKASQELSAVLETSALREYLEGPSGNLAEYIALVSREWDVNPWWAIISGQREQSVIRRSEASIGALNAWQGYVGVDEGHVVYPGYYGIYPQAYRSLSQISWYLNHRPDPRVGKTTQRWRPGIVMRVMKNGVWQDYSPQDRSEFSQLAYTPHIDGYGEDRKDSVTVFNESLARQFCPQFL